jgi:hypothetical protein
MPPTSWSPARLTAQFGLCSPGLHANRGNRALVGGDVAQMWRRRWCLSCAVPRRLSWQALRCAAGHPTWGASLTPIGDPAQPHGIRLSVRCRPEPRARVVSGWPSGGVSDPRGTPPVSTGFSWWVAWIGSAVTAGVRPIAILELVQIRTYSRKCHHANQTELHHSVVGGRCCRGGSRGTERRGGFRSGAADPHRLGPHGKPVPITRQCSTRQLPSLSLLSLLPLLPQLRRRPRRRPVTVTDRGGETPQFMSRDGISPTESRPRAAALSHRGPISSVDIEVSHDGRPLVVRHP